jgi:ArsR family transcriptional regulator
VLKAAGVITGEIDGPRICYALNPAALLSLTTFIQGLVPPPGDACCTPTTRTPA